LLPYMTRDVGCELANDFATHCVPLLSCLGNRLLTGIFI
jgi:hypothetical protein